MSSLNPVSTGNTILAADINQLIYVLQRPSGQTEVGSYFLTGVGTSGITGLGGWVPSQSRNATPVSVTIDTSLQSPTNCNTPNTFHLGQNGFQLATQYTSSTSAANVGGNYTIQY